MHNYQYLNYTKNPHTITLFNRSTRGTHGPQCKPQTNMQIRTQRRERRPFHKDRGLPAFIFFTIWKVWVSSDKDWQRWWFWEMVDDDGGLRERLFNKARFRDSSLIWGFFFTCVPDWLVSGSRDWVWGGKAMCWSGLSHVKKKYHYFISPSATLAFPVSWVTERI